jgi:hypothetical protein
VKLKTVLLSFSVCIPLMAGSAAHAAITVFTDQTLFLAALTASGTDSFETLSIGGATASPLTRSAGAFGYTATPASSTFFGAGSSGDHWLSTNLANTNIVFSNFTGTVTAIGGLFFDSNISGGYTLGDISLHVVDGGGSTDVTITEATTSSFRGFVSDGAISSLTVVPPLSTVAAVWPTVNDLVLGTAQIVPAQSVPEPGTFCLLGGAVSLIGALRRRRAARAR